MSILSVLIILSCASPPRRPLNQKELIVKIVGPNQKNTLWLDEKCSLIPGQLLASDEYGIRVQAASKEANYAQVVYGGDETVTTYAYGSFHNQGASWIRLWKCP
jgi:hypothetical protein